MKYILILLHQAGVLNYHNYYSISHTNILHFMRTLFIAAQRHPNQSIHIDICHVVTEYELYNLILTERDIYSSVVTDRTLYSLVVKNS